MSLSRDSVSGDSELKRLESWKEIATFLNRSVTTVQRWEREEDLPVHRHQHDSLGSVYAFKHELEAWRDTRTMPATTGDGALDTAVESRSDQAALTAERQVGGTTTAFSHRWVPILAWARRRGEHASWILAVLVVIGVLAVVGLWTRATPMSPSEIRLQILTPRATHYDGFALSPDGRFIVLQASVAGRSQLWLRPLQSETAHPLIGTEDALYAPFWSPDSQSIAFFTVDQLKRIDLADGLVRTITDAPNPRGGTWSRAGILFASSTGSLQRVSADGGDKAEATRLLPQQTNHRFPDFLPDGEHFLFFALGTPETRGVYIGSLGSEEPRRLIDADSAARFVRPAHMLFARQGALWAQRLDLDGLSLSDAEPVHVASRVQTDPTTPGVTYFSLATGAVTYRTDVGERQLVWFDRLGREIGPLGKADDAQPGALRLSADGRMVAIRRTVGGNTDIWVMDAVRGVSQRMTSDRAIDFVSDFSEDGSRIVFGSDRAGGISDLYERPVHGGGTDTLLLESSEQKAPVDWSADGRYILYTSQSPKTGIDLWVLPLFGDRKPRPVVQTPFTDGASFSGAEFSSDGRWLAYQSNETGQNEIYIQPFPGPGAKVRMSSGGGTNPRWRQDGRELFYIAPDRRLMAVPLSFYDSTLKHEEPIALFVIPPYEPHSAYSTSPDGQRFLVNTLVGDNSTITIVLNWKALGR